MQTPKAKHTSNQKGSSNTKRLSFGNYTGSTLGALASLSVGGSPPLPSATRHVHVSWLRDSSGVASARTLSRDDRLAHLQTSPPRAFRTAAPSLHAQVRPSARQVFCQRPFTSVWKLSWSHTVRDPSAANAHRRAPLPSPFSYSTPSS
jgi:hypothetical protein